jgi:hypothetical protein
MYSLDDENVQFFNSELTRVELERSSSTNLSQMYLHSEENLFLSEILFRRVDFRFLRWRHPLLLLEALRRSPETIAMAALLWAEFSNLFYIGRGRPVPDLPQYVEIQEGLGIYGRSPIERSLRKFKRRFAKHANVFLNKMFGTVGPHDP